jgi:hypothetical protein
MFFLLRCFGSVEPSSGSIHMILWKLLYLQWIHCFWVSLTFFIIRYLVAFGLCSAWFTQPILCWCCYLEIGTNLSIWLKRVVSPQHGDRIQSLTCCVLNKNRMMDNVQKGNSCMQDEYLKHFNRWIWNETCSSYKQSFHPPRPVCLSSCKFSPVYTVSLCGFHKTQDSWLEILVTLSLKLLKIRSTFLAHLITMTGPSRILINSGTIHVPVILQEQAEAMRVFILLKVCKACEWSL